MVVLEAEDSEVVAGAEDVEDLDRIRDPLWGNLNQEFLSNKVQRRIRNDSAFLVNINP